MTPRPRPVQAPLDHTNPNLTPVHQLPLGDVSGPTFIGEGLFAGWPARFVQLGRCNLTCGIGDASWRCDTPHTWDTGRFDLAKECPDTAVDEILTRAAARQPAPITVVTGGEPLVHQRTPAFEYLLGMLSALGKVHLETNGTIAPTIKACGVVDHFTVSPKLANSGEAPNHRIKPEALRSFNHAAELYGATVSFKFVCTDPWDLDEVDQLVDAHDINRGHVWIVPGGTTPAEVVTRHRKLTEAILERGYNTSTRLHTLLWPTEERPPR